MQPTAIMSHSFGSRNATSSRLALRVGSPGICGSTSHASASVTRKMTATAAYVQRQPAACPSQVPSGTPMTFAIVRPDSASATPAPCLPGPMMRAASSEATPK